MSKHLEVRGKKIWLPMFLPDATRGYVRGVNSEDLQNCKINGVVVNIFHLLQEDLIDKIKKAGGIHKYMGYEGVIISDSGGFQVMSLIRSDPKYGEIRDDDVVFSMDHKRIVLTPEKCIQMQLDIGSDIIMCLDDCTQPGLSPEEQKKSVERTLKWAERCKNEFLRLTKKMNKRPLIFGIIQGGNNLDLRSECAKKLIEIGFDGYAFGGWPVEDGKFLHSLLRFTANLMPEDKLKYAMGVGKPEDIVSCVKMGYDLFDCVIPTREARNNRLYAFKLGLFGARKPIEDNSFYDYVRVRNLSYANDFRVISSFCDCYACKNYKRSDIYNFFKNKDPASIRLATIHNLRFYSMMMEKLIVNDESKFFLGEFISN